MEEKIYADGKEGNQLYFDEVYMPVIKEMERRRQRQSVIEMFLCKKK